MGSSGVKRGEASTVEASRTTTSSRDEASISISNASDLEVMEWVEQDEPGVYITIRELAEMVQRVTGFDGKLVFDASKPDGTPRKLMDVGRMHELGWRHTIELRARREDLRAMG